MEFNVGDHIILKEESVYFSFAGASGSQVKKAGEIPYFRLKEYRLATEKEILKSKLTTIFIK